MIKIILVILFASGGIFILGAILANGGNGATRKSEIERVSVTANVLDDDTMLVSETLYYNTDEINGIRQTYNYNAKQNESIEIESVLVDGVPIKNVPKATKGDSGVYTFKDGSSKQELKIYQQTDGMTTFTTNYRVHGMIKQYNDVQDFNWKIFDATRGSVPLKLDATINFPSQITQDQLQVFGHGDVDGTVSIDGEHVVKVDVTRFYKDTFAEVRVLLPGNPISNVVNRSDEPRLESFLSYEKLEAEKTNELVIANGQKRSNARFLLVLIAALWFGTMICLFRILNLFYTKYDEEQYTVQLDYYREVPPYSPAVAARILDSASETGQPQLIATIFNLYIKKLINLSDLKKDVQIELLKRSDDLKDIELTPDELFVYQWLVESFGEQGIGTYKEFFNIGRRTRGAALEFERQFTKFQNRALQEYRRLGFELREGINDPLPTSMRRLAFIFIGFTCFIGLSRAFGNIDAYPLTVMIVLIVLFFSAFGLLVWYKNQAYQLTEEGATRRAQVIGLKNYLNDYSLLSEAEPTAVHLWEKYFVYGLALGVSKKALNRLYQQIPQAMQTSTDWHMLYMMHYLSHNYDIVRRSERAVNSMAQITGAGTTRSSGGASFGGGGGFSGGGGFGSGGTSSGSF